MSDSITSLPSPKIRFKELDVEFLQKQARIWLETVVGERYDQNISLSSLLADGEILRKVSSKIWEFIQKHGDKESTCTGALFPEASSNGKHSGRYLPYSNIDTFLKVCQKIGLTGVDLFSPPDVVEEKDIRRVCLCVRALSQKARARNVKVPNFDYVTHSSVLPTEMVGGVKSLTNHLNAAIIESKETPEKLLWSPLLPKKSIDQKGINGLPHLSSVEIPKDKDCISSSPITDACPPKLNGKSYKTTTYAKGVLLSSSEEISKSTNDSKVISASEETTVYYEGFRKKINRALFEDDTNLKQSSHLTHQLLYTPETDEDISYTTSSNGGDNSEGVLCTMNSPKDTSKCPSDSMDEKKMFEQSVGKNPPAGEGGKHKSRRTWPVVTVTMAVLGAVFIFRPRPIVYQQTGKDNSLLQISKRDKTTSFKTDIIHSDENIKLQP